MSRHDYICEHCNITREVEHKITEEPVVFCECGKEMTKQFSVGTSFILNGTGWVKKSQTVVGVKKDGSEHAV